MINSIQSYQNVPRFGTSKQTNANSSPNFGATFSSKIANDIASEIKAKGKKFADALQGCAEEIEQMIQQKAHPDTVATLEFYRISPEVLDKSKTNVSGCIELSRESGYTYRFLSILLERAGKKCRLVNNEHLSDVNDALRRIEGIVKRNAKKQAVEAQKTKRRQALIESFKPCSGLLQSIREKGLNR